VIQESLSLKYAHPPVEGCSVVSSLAQVRNPPFFFFFFFITLKPRVEGYTKSVSLKYEPASEPLHISVKWLFSN